MVTKLVQIDFADSNRKAADAIADIRKAQEYVCLNLFGRYDVRLEMPQIAGGKVTMEVKIPDEIADTFAIGPHLKGIAMYLLKADSKYQDFLVGRRLLEYTVLSDSRSFASDSLTLQDKVSIVSRLVEMIKFDDKDTLVKFSRIRDILEEKNDYTEGI